MPVERFYSVKETCAILGGIGRNKLWELRKQGEIEYLRIGNRPVFAESQIAAYQQRLLGRAPQPVATTAQNASDYSN